MNDSNGKASVLDRRFIPLTAAQEILSFSKAQAYALVRSGELRSESSGAGS
ncbi:hypothetical protein [Brachybacterium epidermidis]|uniref:hypothetical protein n=1 Tax=Brachybacterium epidermidis TaxID=2781983 RepID=UPI00398F0226